MSQTILIEDNLTNDTIFSLNLEVYVGTDVISKRSLREVMELFKLHSEFDLIICKNIINETKIAVEIYKYLSMMEKSIPMIVIGDEHLLESKAIILPKDVQVNEVIKAAARCLGVTPKDMIMLNIPDFFPIPIEFFASFGALECPVYLKLPSQQAEQFLKRFLPGDIIVHEDISKLIKKGIKKLYIPKNERLKFTNKVTERLTAALNSNDLPDDERSQLTDTSIKVIRDELQEAGFTKDTMELANSAIHSIKSLVATNPTLSALLQLLMKDTNSYHYRLTQLTTYVSFHVLENLEWGTPEQQDKLAFVALFHDITLESDKAVKVRTEKDLMESYFNQKERAGIQMHALNAAKLVSSFPRSPLGAETIIKQHHGSIGGTGFAVNFSGNISPLAIVFIICEEYAHQTLSSSSKKKDLHESIVDDLKKKFPKVQYQKVIKTLVNLKILKV